MISVKKLGKRFGARWLFRGLEFCVERSECLLVTGPNGSGKSTLLRILAGLERATEGELHGQPATLVSPAIRLYSNLKVREHLELAAQLSGRTADYRLLERVGLEAHSDALERILSTGMRTRLKLALATQQNADVWLLDEPATGLDAAGKLILEELVGERLQTGSVVIATNEEYERRFAHLELALA